MTVVKGLTFSKALLGLQAGERLQREGWNGKNMYLIMVNPAPYAFDVHGNESPFIGMKTAQDTFEAGWRPTTMDMLATDWIILD